MRFIRDLNPESQKMLERIYRASKHHQVRERAKCILLSFQGTTIEELSGIFGVTRKTIYNWLTAWEDRKLIGFYNRRGRGRKPKLTEAQSQQVIDWVKEEPKSLKKNPDQNCRRREINRKQRHDKKTDKKNQHEVEKGEKRDGQNP